MCLANPGLGASAAVKELRRLHQDHGYIGVRFNPSLFADKNIADAAGLALFKAAEEMQLVVGLMCFTGVDEQIDALKELMRHAPKTRVIIDHCGFFRQPAFGGFAEGEGKAENREEAFSALLGLAAFPNVFVKMSAMFRISGRPFPHVDLIPRLLALLEAFGKERVLWGSDFPFVTLGGHEKTAFAVPYARASGIFDEWIEYLARADANGKDNRSATEAARSAARQQAQVLREAKEFMLWRNAATLFHFDV